ncbi:MAG: metal-sensitive transcriptional regulator [Actinomycetota bacterium]
MIEDIKKRSLHRVKILEGQIRGLEKMIDQEEYCMDIITQSLAIQKSIGSLNKLIVENHLRTHISHALASGESKKVQAALAELIDIYELNNNRGKNK